MPYSLKSGIFLFWSRSFQIDSELYQGRTFVSETYENKRLNGLEKDDCFKCMKLEIYALE